METGRFQNPKLDGPEIERLRDQEDEREYRRRYSGPLIIACAVLALAVAGLIWYSYPRFKQQESSMAQLRDEIRGRDQQLKNEGSQNTSTHDRLRNEAEKLREDVRDLSRRTGQAAKDAYNRIEAKLNGEIKARTAGMGTLNDRVSNLEASRTADQTQLAQLKQQVNELQQQTPPQQLAGSPSGSAAVDQADAAGPSNGVPVEKVPFQATTDRPSEVANGITLHLSGTDVTGRSASGWLWLANEHRSIFLHQQNELQPVVFYGAGDGQKRELVITGVTPDSVTGYLLLPKEGLTAPLGQAGAGGE